MQISLGGPNWPWSEIVLNLQCFVCANNFYSVAVKCSLFLSSVKIVATNDSDSSHLITAYYSFIDPERMKGWVGLVSWHTGDGYPNKWLPISCRSGAGQWKFAGQRLTFYHWATPPTCPILWHSCPYDIDTCEASKCIGSLLNLLSVSLTYSRYIWVLKLFGFLKWCFNKRKCLEYGQLCCVWLGLGLWLELGFGSGLVLALVYLCCPYWFACIIPINDKLIIIVYNNTK